jgi:hypothetical protein
VTGINYYNSQAHTLGRESARHYIAALQVGLHDYGATLPPTIQEDSRVGVSKIKSYKKSLTTILINYKKNNYIIMTVMQHALSIIIVQGTTSQAGARIQSGVEGSGTRWVSTHLVLDHVE